MGVLLGGAALAAGGAAVGYLIGPGGPRRSPLPDRRRYLVVVGGGVVAVLGVLSPR